MVIWSFIRTNDTRFLYKFKLNEDVYVFEKLVAGPRRSYNLKNNLIYLRIVVPNTGFSYKNKAIKNFNIY